jgi:hypothetical protein
MLDLFTVKFLLSFADKPIHLFGGLGFALILISVATPFVLIVRRITLDEHLIRTPLLLLTPMHFILGCMSILNGLPACTYHELQARPTYNVRQVVKTPAIETTDNLVRQLEQA